MGEINIEKQIIPRKWIHPENVLACESCDICGSYSREMRNFFDFESDSIGIIVGICADCRPAAPTPLGIQKCAISGLIFRCPYEKCDAKLTFDKFFEHLRVPCNIWEPKANQSNIDSQINQLHNQIKRLEELKKTEAELSQEKRSFEDRKTELEKIQDEINEVSTKLKSLRSKEKQVFRTINFKDIKIAELTSKYEELKKDGVPSQQKKDDGLSCGVCFENYGGDHHQACIATCFHSFCFSCLNSLNPKNCPKCRKSFNDSQIKKIY